MFRHRRHRLMKQLALLAVVLLATVPTLGRMASTPVSHAASVVATLHADADAPGPHHAAASATALAGPMRAVHDMSMHGMPVHDMSMHDMSMHAMAMDHAAMQHSGHLAAATAASTHHDHPGGGPHAGHDGDCAYCPLLHSLLGALVLTLLATPEGALPPPQVREVAAKLSWHYPAGLGSRGPPAPL